MLSSLSLQSNKTEDDSDEGAPVLVPADSRGCGAEASVPGQPTEACLQHHCFLSSDHPALRLPSLSSQSNRPLDCEASADAPVVLEVVCFVVACVDSVVGCPGEFGSDPVLFNSGVGQPIDACWQHHCNLSSDHLTRSACPDLQSNKASDDSDTNLLFASAWSCGAAVMDDSAFPHPTEACWQHQSFLSSGQFNSETVAPSLQSKSWSVPPDRATVWFTVPFDAADSSEEGVPAASAGFP
mmetsp:Transcript_98985/g.317447  ORF Transcript_98985/g.317447 Transcript_98985/m.317447 type:complete len:240 (+) Transcript_98985:2705-3424(+)